jgi:hypothetical protein
MKHWPIPAWAPKWSELSFSVAGRGFAIGGGHGTAVTIAARMRNIAA